jgi:hypothetical protein
MPRLSFKRKNLCVFVCSFNLKKLAVFFTNEAGPENMVRTVASAASSLAWLLLQIDVVPMLGFMNLDPTKRLCRRSKICRLQSSAEWRAVPLKAEDWPSGLRGGSDHMDDENNIADQWDMITGQDSFNVSVTYLQLRSHPFTLVELWWDSGGRFRFTYEATGSDVMCAWPQGSTSNVSAWEVDSLVEDIKEALGTAAISERHLKLGRWRLNVQDSFINITNTQQSENELLLTGFGFVFFDCFGRALINRGAYMSPSVSRRMYKYLALNKRLSGSIFVSLSVILMLSMKCNKDGDSQAMACRRQTA